MIEFITENQAVLIAIAMLVGGLIVKLTPTKVDDAWFQKIKALLGKK